MLNPIEFLYIFSWIFFAIIKIYMGFKYNSLDNIDKNFDKLDILSYYCAFTAIICLMIDAAFDI